MARNWWRGLPVAVDGFGQIGSSVSLPLAAGETVGRFLLHGAAIWHSEEVQQTNTIGLWEFNAEVRLWYSPLTYVQLYRTSRRIPAVTYSLFNAASNDPRYLTYFHAGDNEVGINQQTSYGGQGRPMDHLQLVWGVNPLIAQGPGGEWHAQFTFTATGRLAR